jgi:hypothetical protein
MDDCKRPSLARLTNQDGDLYDGDLLPMLMVEIAQWNNSSYHLYNNAEMQMRKLRNLLADALYKMAEREVGNG